MTIVLKVARHLKQGTFLNTCKNIIFNKIQPYANPIGDNYYGEKAAIYEKHRENDQFWGEEDKVLKNVIERFPKGISVLDVPFGTGRFVPFYVEREMVISGLDSSKDMIAQAGILLKEQFLQCDVHVGNAVAMPFADNQFDLVVCFRFLSWIVSFSDMKIILKELSRVCGKYAVLEFCVGKSNVSGKKVSEQQTLWNKLNRAELITLLSRYGFKTLDVIEIVDEKEHPGLSAFVCEKYES